MSETFQEISPADFFYRNREIAGFTNPARAIFTAIRELVENSLDATEPMGILPDIYIRLTLDGQNEVAETYTLRIMDNGSGIPAHQMPLALGQFLFSSKYKLKQARGTFGLGGTMTILYGQITTNKPVTVFSSTGTSRIVEYRLMIDIQRNKPIILDRKIHVNPQRGNERWHGTIIELHLEGSYGQASSKVLEYLKQTAIVNPYANITFIDPKGRFYKFERTVTEVPRPPKETEPHPHGVDVETIQRIIRATNARNMLDFMKNNFHRVGDKTAADFLKAAGIPEKINPKRLRPEEIVMLVQKMKEYKGFLPPDASCLSSLGEDLLRAGVLKELEPEFVAVKRRDPSTYSGHPFIVEAAIAYGGKVPAKDEVLLYRFANKIPLVYDESGDVCWRIVRSINWRRYNVTPNMPVAVLIHLCSTKIPYKTVGKEILSDQAEVSREILNAIREVARELALYLSRKERVRRQVRRLNVFARYLPKIAEFSAKLSGIEKPPETDRLYRSQVVFKNFVTRNEFTESEPFDSRIYKTVLVHIINKHETNAVNVKVVGQTSSHSTELIPESTLTSGSEIYETLRGNFTQVKVLAKSSKTDKEGLIDAYIDGISE
ncbi:DNA topoisomerase VI subunit B [Candidatus Bathyarchaeota archaeon]|nr:DNA topoisomerase VI subunit B [Candidatus Bathyarchaeota archaeon]